MLTVGLPGLPLRTTIFRLPKAAAGDASIVIERQDTSGELIESLVVE